MKSQGIGPLGQRERREIHYSLKERRLNRDLIFKEKKYC
jgi:hypothetical protein